MLVKDVEDGLEESVRAQHARGDDIDDGDALFGGDSLEVDFDFGARPTISVPSLAGFNELSTSTGMFFCTAGSTVAGCRTLAPK